MAPVRKMVLMLMLMLPNLRQQCRVLSIMDPFPPFHHPHKWLLWSFYNKEIRRAQPSRVSNGEDTGNQKESQMFWNNPNILQKGRRIKTFCQKFNHIYVETLNLRRKQVGTDSGENLFVFHFGEKLFRSLMFIRKVSKSSWPSTFAKAWAKVYK